VLDYIRTHGAITVAESSHRLNIHHLPRRIMDLLEMGYPIKRNDHRVFNYGSSKWVTITVYSLRKPKVKRKIEQLNLNFN